MGQIFILFFFYFTVLFSILGYGKLVTLFNSNNQDNEFDGINGIYKTNDNQLMSLSFAYKISK